MASTPPLVSVVMPAFNAAGTITEAIASVMAQTHEELELIVCDDASADDTANKIRAFGDRRIRVLKNSDNRGEGYTRDRAIAAASGQWIAMLDADDAWEPYRLTRLLQAAVSLSGGEANLIVFDDIMECHDTPEGLVPWRPVRGPDTFGHSEPPGQHIDVNFANFIRSPRLLIKPLIPTQLIRKSGVRHSSIRFGGDTEFFLQLIACGLQMRYVPEAMYLYRITPASMSAISMKHRLMREVLEASRPAFVNHPEFLASLSTRIAKEARAEAYRPFLVSIKKAQFAEAIRQAITRPWVVLEFTRRVWEQIPYEVHRALHKGKRRGER